MGNWRTVNISGHIGTDEVETARDVLTRAANYDPWMYDDGENEELCALYCLAFGEGICGLHDWIQPSGDINAIGNLHERDFDNDDIEKALSILAKRFPTLSLTLHSGDDWESLHCTATFHVKDGECKRCPPEIEELNEISSESMMNNFFGGVRCYMKASFDSHFQEVMDSITEKRRQYLADMDDYIERIKSMRVSRARYYLEESNEHKH